MKKEQVKHMSLLSVALRVRLRARLKSPSRSPSILTLASVKSVLLGCADRNIATSSSRFFATSSPFENLQFRTSRQSLHDICDNLQFYRGKLRPFGTMSEAQAPQPASEASQTQAPESSSTEQKETPAAPELPPLSPAEFKVYNKMADKMDLFHNHFRSMWNMLHTAASTNKRPQGMSLKQFIDEGLQFIQYLTAHHSIEETYVFPMLARRMPEFRGGRAELLRQHREIHKGMDVFEDYLKRCRAREIDFEMAVLKEKMDSWGEVLWTHLDQEVETLGAENMRKYWTAEEIRGMPM